MKLVHPLVAKTKRPKQSRKFTPVQIIELNTLYRSGMKGVGRQYASAIEHASTRTGLTSDQVKVS